MEQLVGLVEHYELLETRNKKPYTKCTMTLEDGTSRGLTVWSEVLPSFELCHSQSHVLMVTGSVSTYDNDIVVSMVEALTDRSEDEFRKTFPVADYIPEFQQLLGQTLSEPYKKVVNLVLAHFGDGFLKAAAAIKFHDAQVGGLFAHTLKMLRIMKVLCEQDTRMARFKDNVILGVVCHDLGKVYEIVKGKYTDIGSKLGHSAIMTLELAKLLDQIVELIGEDNFIRILAIVDGHHNGLGDSNKAKTAEALIVHVVDMVDAKVTGILDMIEKSAPDVQSIRLGGDIYVV